jgi:hypothetical protein
MQPLNALYVVSCLLANKGIKLVYADNNRPERKKITFDTACGICPVKEAVETALNRNVRTRLERWFPFESGDDFSPWLMLHPVIHKVLHPLRSESLRGQGYDFAKALQPASVHESAISR